MGNKIPRIKYKLKVETGLKDIFKEKKLKLKMKDCNIILP